jgi:hypothetical protein
LSFPDAYTSGLEPSSLGLSPLAVRAERYRIAPGRPTMAGGAVWHWHVIGPRVHGENSHFILRQVEVLVLTTLVLCQRTCMCEPRASGVGMLSDGRARKGPVAAQFFSRTRQKGGGVDLVGPAWLASPVVPLLSIPLFWGGGIPGRYGALRLGKRRGWIDLI